MRVELTTDIDACLVLRRAVFIDEQGVPEAEEIDGLDDQALHVLGYLADRPVATARMFLVGATGKIGRVCVLAEARGTGLGVAVMELAIRALRERGASTVKLSSQSYAVPFYERLGFVAYGSEYPDAGIPHRDMVLEL